MPKKSQNLKLILASSSPYRQEILNKLGLYYKSISPDIDESPLQLESPPELVARLAIAKAKAAADILTARAIDLTNANENLIKPTDTVLIIGSDQVAVLDNEIITKPHTHNKACQQLRSASGREVIFLTSLCVYNLHTKAHQLCVVPYVVNFLPLTDEQIESYLKKEQPYNCAGSFKSEGLGITLFESIKGDDPNTLVGLPLIALVKMLREEGVDPLSE
jgi:MAF protein